MARLRTPELAWLKFILACYENKFCHGFTRINTDKIKGSPHRGVRVHPCKSVAKDFHGFRATACRHEGLARKR